MSLESSNSRFREADPCRDEDEISLMPWTPMRASSRTSVTSVSITSGAAPSHPTLTLSTGKSTSGSWLTPIRPKPKAPNTMSPIISIQAKAGFLMETSESIMAAPPWPPTSGWR